MYNRYKIGSAERIYFIMLYTRTFLRRNNIHTGSLSSEFLNFISYNIELLDLKYTKTNDLKIIDKYIILSG